jgi:hypothetical protein
MIWHNARSSRIPRGNREYVTGANDAVAEYVVRLCGNKDHIIHHNAVFAEG